MLLRGGQTSAAGRGIFGERAMNEAAGSGQEAGGGAECAHVTPPTRALPGTWPGTIPAAGELLRLVGAENCSQPTGEPRPPFLDHLLRMPSPEAAFSVESLGRRRAEQSCSTGPLAPRSDPLRRSQSDPHFSRRCAVHVPTGTCPPGAGSMQEFIALHARGVPNRTVGDKQMTPRSLAGRRSGVGRELNAEGTGPDEKGQLRPS